MRINTNISALNAWKNLSVTGNMMAKSLEKLSSGYRINRAADDAAGLAISEKMRAQTAGLRQAARNAQDGISLIQTAEGALNETHAILQRMRELMVQAGNDTNKLEDRQKIQEEIGQLVLEINGIAERTEFNGQTLLSGALGAKTSVTDLGVGGELKIVDVSGSWVGEKFTVTTGDNTDGNKTITLEHEGLTQTITVADLENVAKGTRFHFDKFGITLEATATDVSGVSTANTFDIVSTGATLQIGANANQTLAISIGSMMASDLGVDTIDVSDLVGAAFSTQLDLIDTAISTVSSERAKLGAYQNRLEHTINNLQTAEENLTAAESRIRDVDMALEMANFTRHQILQQAGTAMLAQANLTPQSVLKLLG